MRNFLQDIRYKQQYFQQQGYNTSLLRAFLSDGSSANFLYRLTSWLQWHHLQPLALSVLWLNKILNSCMLGAGCRFGPGLILMHPVGIIINSKVTGGDNIIIQSGVVIGDERGKAPILGSNIFIGAGAKIIGDVKIGDNVKIGANAVVVKDVPDNVTVVGIPAKIVSKRAE
ncbi:serine O-acetyltransferase [Alishewanella sp. SMS8]|uniref:serine O-acetyltransferase n=1 Tax=Alishewanella sp. SMS8 TaxID=2994676 RepID=UPI0027421C11|nr:serine acetyltransferase [Alishewanella sp. SMS8]MDP5458148.1 serine acetyltransferase [Alishewanella sp. SMS8]